MIVGSGMVWLFLVGKRLFSQDSEWDMSKGRFQGSYHLECDWKRG